MKKTTFAAIAILVIATAVGIASVWNDSPIVDEIPHIGAGYDYIIEQSYKFNPEHPPLAKDLAGLGVLTLPNLRQPPLTGYQSNWPTDVHGQWNFGRTLIFSSGNDAISLVRRAKLPEFILFFLTGWIIFVWARKRYGDRTGLLAVFLFAFAPTVIAHSRFVTTDMAALFGVMLGTYFLVRYLQSQTTGNFWLATVAIGIAMLTKFSTFLLLPYFVMLALIWGYAYHSILRTVWKAVLASVLGFIIIVGPVYQIHLINFSGAQQKSDTSTIFTDFNHPNFVKPLVWASDKPLLRPFAWYGTGLLMIFQRNGGGNTTFFLGENYKTGQKAYFPFVYFVKEPLPFWGLVLIALISLIWFIRPKESRFRLWVHEHFEELAMLLWLAIYWYFSITANVNIGVRHLMPTYGFTYILLAGQIILFGQYILNKYGKRAHRGYNILVYALILWFLAESVSVFPYYLTYFNETVGGPSGGYRYVADSNLDWGQDAKRLADWTKANNIQKLYFDYFGWADPAYYLGSAYRWINSDSYTSAQKFLADNPAGGYIAVSATYYDQSTAVNGGHQYDWLKAYRPVAVIGNSIFVWHIVQ